MRPYELRFGSPDEIDGAPRASVLPVPYDRTACYQAGARRGPDAILLASANMEFFDEVLGFDPSSVGIETLTPIDPRSDGPRGHHDTVRDAVGEILGAGRLPILLGGDHSVCIGAIEAVTAHDPSVSILHVDAHADLRDTWEGSPWSHACVMARAAEHAAAVSVGIRSYSEGELPEVQKRKGRFFTLPEARRVRFDPEVLFAGLTEKVYLTLDVDVLDPSIMPATGTPEPGGMTWVEIDGLLAALCARHTLVGADVVELMPIPGMVAPDYLVARLVYRLIGRALAPDGHRGR
jgi:agmatinase